MTDPLLSALESQRAMIMAELHDDTVQVLRACALRLDAVGVDLSPAVTTTVCDVVRDLQAAADRMGVLLGALRPPDLRDGIGGALIVLATRIEADHGLQVELEVAVADGGAEPGEAQAITLYRVAQESLRNVVRHADADVARVRLEHRRDGHHLSVDDDGVGGCDAWLGDLERPRVGWELMRRRTAALGGRIEMTCDGAPGTVVRLFLPSYAP